MSLILPACFGSSLSEDRMRHPIEQECGPAIRFKPRPPVPVSRSKLRQAYLYDVPSHSVGRRYRLNKLQGRRVEFYRLQHGADHRSAFTTRIGTQNKKFFASNGDGSQRTFGLIAVDPEPAIFGVQAEGLPSGQRLLQSLGEAGLRRQPPALFRHPGFKIGEDGQSLVTPNLLAFVRSLTGDLGFDCIKLLGPPK
jgi:hypothetical protein